MYIRMWEMSKFELTSEQKISQNSICPPHEFHCNLMRIFKLPFKFTSYSFFFFSLVFFIGNNYLLYFIIIIATTSFFMHIHSIYIILGLI